MGRIRKAGGQATDALDQATGGRLRPRLDATKEKVSDVGSTVTGKKIQQQIEEFTDVVSTAVIGVHSDQRTLKTSLTQMQVQQTGLKLEIAEVRGEQSKVKETLVQVKQDQDDVQKTIAQIQSDGSNLQEVISQVQARQAETTETLAGLRQQQDTLAKSIQQFNDSLHQMEKPARIPWWQFWHWRWM